MLSKNPKCLATHILKTFLFCYQAVDTVLYDESLPNNNLAASSLPAPSDNGETSENAPSVPSVNGKSSDKAVDVSVPETSTFTSGIQSACVRGADLCLYQLYNIVDEESVLVKIPRLLVGVEFILVEVQFVLVEVQLVLVNVLRTT